MTPLPQDDLAAGRELDALVAEKVFGMRVERVRPPWYQGGRVEVLCFYAPGFDHMEYSYDANSCNAMMYRNGRDSSDGTAPTLPYYSDDIAAAWQIVEWAEASPRGWKLTLMRSGRSLPDYVWICTFHRGHVELARVVERNAPVAICKAVLVAVR